MFSLFLSTIITCSDAVKIINRIVFVGDLSVRQKYEIISELRKLVPTCPVIVKQDEPPKK